MIHIPNGEVFRLLSCYTCRLEIREEAGEVDWWGLPMCWDCGMELRVSYEQYMREKNSGTTGLGPAVTGLIGG